MPYSVACNGKSLGRCVGYAFKPSRIPCSTWAAVTSYANVISFGIVVLLASAEPLCMVLYTECPDRGPDMMSFRDTVSMNTWSLVTSRSQSNRFVLYQIKSLCSFETTYTDRDT